MKDYVVMIIPIDAEPYMAVWQLPGPENLRDLLTALENHIEPITGSPMEHVHVYADFNGGRQFKYLDMFVNEEGALDPKLPVNVMASAIYANNTLMHQPNVRREEIPFIHGPAVLFEEKIWL